MDVLLLKLSLWVLGEAIFHWKLECLPAWLICRIGCWGLSQLLCPLWWDFLPWVINSPVKLFTIKSIYATHGASELDQKMNAYSAWLRWDLTHFEVSLWFMKHPWKMCLRRFEGCDLRDCLWLRFQGIGFTWKHTSLLKSVLKNKNWGSTREAELSRSGGEC